MRSAFLPGAGLGTRLRPLTDQLPKPLIPVFNKPLAEFHLDHLIAAGYERFIINTHHCPHRWKEHFGGDDFEGAYRGYPVHLRHEPVLLETGGGLKNIEDLAGGEDLLLCNADTLHDLDLGLLMATHRREGNAVTLGLRSSDGPLHVQWDAGSGRVMDIRQSLGKNACPSYLFTGLYVVSPEIFSWIRPGTITSVIPVFLAMLQAGRKVGGVLLDEGLWLDLGTPQSYLQAHQALQERAHRLSFPLANPLQPIAPSAVVQGRTEGFISIADGCHCAPGSQIQNSVLWKDVTLEAGASVEFCVVRSGRVLEPGPRTHEVI
jgi:mannose-1-phosphate guanylyltransferase